MAPLPIIYYFILICCVCKFLAANLTILMNHINKILHCLTVNSLKLLFLKNYHNQIKPKAQDEGHLGIVISFLTPQKTIKT